jgi:hypothetical protein
MGAKVMVNDQFESIILTFIGLSLSIFNSLLLLKCYIVSIRICKTIINFT